MQRQCWTLTLRVLRSSAVLPWPVNFAVVAPEGTPSAGHVAVVGDAPEVNLIALTLLRSAPLVVMVLGAATAMQDSTCCS